MTMPVSYVAERLFGGEHLILASNDPDEVIDGCSKALRPHRLHLNGRGSALATRLHHVPIGSFSMSRLCYGSDVTVVPEFPQGGHFLVTLPLQGSARFRYGAATAELKPGQGSIVGPYQECQLDIDGSFDQILLRLDRRRVERLCADLAGVEQAAPVNFDLSLRDTPAFWHKLLEAAASLSLLGNRLAHPKLFIRLEELIIESLLVTQPNNFSAAISAATQPARSAQLRRAMDYMRAHIGEPMRLGQVARHCGLSLRSLQAGFQRELGVSPSRWLRAERLDRVHAVLASAPPGTVSVTDVALQWGFVHLGDFASQFKDRFGQKPSAVLAKQTS